MIIDTQYIVNNALNLELVDLATNNTPLAEKIIKYVESKVFLMICKSEFEDAGSNPLTYTFPEDLKQVTLHLVESYFVTFGTDGTKKQALRSVKFDDFAESFYEEKNPAFTPLSFYGIPILEEYQTILECYQCTTPELLRGTFTTNNF